MEFMPWKEEYVLGFKTIDLQHKQLVSLINNLYKNMIRVGSEQSTEKIIEELVNYTNIHFKYEEEIFLSTNFVLTSEHIAEHNQFCKEIAQYCETGENKKNIESKVLVLLKDWLKNHILSSDQKYIEHFKRNEIE